MKRAFLFLSQAAFSVPALADRYGLDELRDEGTTSVGVIVVCVLLFAYLYFKKK